MAPPRWPVHPVIRLLLLAVAAGCLAGGRPLVLALASAVLVSLLLVTRFRDWRGLGRGLGRLRWFYLSIAVIYLWFTPGTALAPALGTLSPSLEGLFQGLGRIAVLVLLLVAVRLLFHTSRRDELVAAIDWWSRPLSWLGLDCSRLGLRLVLALELLPRLQQLARRCWRVARGQPAWRRVPAVGAVLLAATLRRAERAPCPQLAVPRLPGLVPADWLLALAAAAPLLLAALAVPN